MQYSAHVRIACVCLFIRSFFSFDFRKCSVFCPKRISSVIVALSTFRVLYIGYWLIGGGEIQVVGLELSCGIVTYCLRYLTTVDCCSKCDS